MYTLREACTLDDFEDYLALKSQKDAIKWSGFTSAPERESFKTYFIDRVLNNPVTHVFFLCDQDVEGAPVVGYRQYDQISDTEIEIRGTSIKKSYQGTDAIEALNTLLEIHYKEKGYNVFTAWISEMNKASEYNSSRNGWVKTEEFVVKEMPLLGGAHRFFKWIRIYKAQ